MPKKTISLIQLERLDIEGNGVSEIARKLGVTKGAVSKARMDYADQDPGDCERCTACGFWDGHGSEPFCLFEAYFLGRKAPAQLVKDKARGFSSFGPQSKPREPLV